VNQCAQNPQRGNLFSDATAAHKKRRIEQIRRAIGVAFNNNWHENPVITSELRAMEPQLQADWKISYDDINDRMDLAVFHQRERERAVRELWEERRETAVSILVWCVFFVVLAFVGAACIETFKWLFSPSTSPSPSQREQQLAEDTGAGTGTGMVSEAITDIKTKRTYFGYFLSPLWATLIYGALPLYPLMWTMSFIATFLLRINRHRPMQFRQSLAICSFFPVFLPYVFFCICGRSYMRTGVVAASWIIFAALFFQAWPFTNMMRFRYFPIFLYLYYIFCDNAAKSLSFLPSFSPFSLLPFSLSLPLPALPSSLSSFLLFMLPLPTSPFCSFIQKALYACFGIYCVLKIRFENRRAQDANKAWFTTFLLLLALSFTNFSLGGLLMFQSFWSVIMSLCGILFGLILSVVMCFLSTPPLPP